MRFKNLADQNIIGEEIRLFWAWPVALGFLAFMSRPFLFYFFSHPGLFTRHSAIGCLGFVLDGIFALVLMAGFFHLGRLALNCFKLSPETFSIGEKAVVSLVIGESVVAFLIFFFGLASLYRAWIFLSIYVALALGAFQERRLIAQYLSRLANLFFEKRDLLSVICWTAIIIALLNALAGTSAPPTDWDSLGYHLALPKMFLHHGKFLDIRWSGGDAYYPLNTEMIYLLALALRGDIAAHWINLLHGISLLVVISLTASRYFGRRASELACAIFSVQPLFQRVIGNAETDINVALIVMAALIVFLAALREKNTKKQNRVLLLCGILSGLAMSAKLTGMWAVATLFILTLAYFGFAFMRPQAYYAIGAALCGLPWYLKNWIWTGNPVWPFFGRFFGSSTAEQIWQREMATITEGVSRTPFHYFSTPFLLVLTPEHFLYGPQFLVLPFLILLAAKVAEKRSILFPEAPLLWFILLFYTFWFFIDQEWRYLLPVAAVMSILAGAWTIEMAHRKRRIFKIASVAILFCFFPLKDLSPGNSMYAFFHLVSARGVMASRERYLELSLGPSYMVESLANRILPQNAKVLLFRDVRGYYLDRDYAWGDPANSAMIWHQTISNPEALRLKLLRLGFTHVLYNPFIAGYKGNPAYFRQANTLMAALLKREPILSCIGGVCLYRLE